VGGEGLRHAVLALATLFRERVIDAAVDRQKRRQAMPVSQPANRPRFSQQPVEDVESAIRRP